MKFTIENLNTDINDIFWNSVWGTIWHLVYATVVPTVRDSLNIDIIVPIHESINLNVDYIVAEYFVKH